MRIDERRELALAMTSDGASSKATAALVRADVLVLLREKRYEDALAMLYQARAESPGSAELQKSIDQIKQFLIGAYAKRLGGLDQIAKPIPPSAGRSPDVVLLSRYIDGKSTFGDVAQMSPLGQLRTLQVLIALYARAEPSPLSDPGPPNSGLRVSDRPAGEGAGADSLEPVPLREADTEASQAPVVPLPAETEESRKYRELFVLGTAAFVQNRYADAVEAFDACDRVRPGDYAAAVMLRRSRRDLESR